MQKILHSAVFLSATISQSLEIPISTHFRCFKVHKERIFVWFARFIGCSLSNTKSTLQEWEDTNSQIHLQFLNPPKKSSASYIGLLLEHLQLCSVCDPAKMFLTSKLEFFTFFCPNPPIQLKLGLQTVGRLLIATDLDQPNYLANQK